MPPLDRHKQSTSRNEPLAEQYCSNWEFALWKRNAPNDEAFLFVEGSEGSVFFQVNFFL